MHGAGLRGAPVGAADLLGRVVLVCIGRLGCLRIEAAPLVVVHIHAACGAVRAPCISRTVSCVGVGGGGGGKGGSSAARTFTLCPC